MARSADRCADIQHEMGCGMLTFGCGPSPRRDTPPLWPVSHSQPHGA